MVVADAVRVVVGFESSSEVVISIAGSDVVFKFLGFSFEEVVSSTDKDD